MQVRLSPSVHTDGQIVVLDEDGRPDLNVPEELAPEPGGVALLPSPTHRWALVTRAPVRDWTRLGADMVRRAPDGTVSFAEAPAAPARRAFVRGWVLGGYSPRRDRPTRKVLTLPDSSPDIADVLAAAGATLQARDWVNTPSSVKSPAWLIQRARRVAADSGAGISVLSPTELREAGFGGVLAVGSGSSRPPQVVIIRKRGRGPKVALVGKGVTFDSGGLSLKPSDSMALMKTDMAGAAAVLAAVPLAPDAVDLTVLLGVAENMPSGHSYRPGDVVRHFDGQTSEVLNTDAEGRLILADLLGYARLRVKPDVLVDVATLTGAATVALSRHVGALFATRDDLRDGLFEAGSSVGEALWPMPLVSDYAHSLDSRIADRAHIPTDPGVGAGAVTAALFLRSFVGDLPWAHLDIAGPARATATEGASVAGGTGFGAALLGEWMRRLVTTRPTGS